MQYYEMWFNLKDSHRDVEFARNVDAYLGHLKSQGKIEGWRLTPCKFGFGPPSLGEFNVTVWTQLLHGAARYRVRPCRHPGAGEVEKLHMPVYSMVTDFVSAPYRDFPDPVRKAAEPAIAAFRRGGANPARTLSRVSVGTRTYAMPRGRRSSSAR